MRHISRFCEPGRISAEKATAAFSAPVLINLLVNSAAPRAAAVFAAALAPGMTESASWPAKPAVVASAIPFWASAADIPKLFAKVLTAAFRGRAAPFSPRYARPQVILDKPQPNPPPTPFIPHLAPKRMGLASGENGINQSAVAKEPASNAPGYFTLSCL